MSASPVSSMWVVVMAASTALGLETHRSRTARGLRSASSRRASPQQPARATERRGDRLVGLHRVVGGETLVEPRSLDEVDDGDGSGRSPSWPDSSHWRLTMSPDTEPTDALAGKLK